MNTKKLAFRIALFALGFAAIACICPLFNQVPVTVIAQATIEAQYQVTPGTCFVEPQGNPVYDQFYSDINKKNCEAFAAQGDGMAKQAVATITVAQANDQVLETQKKSEEMWMNRIGAGATVVITFIVAVLIIIALIRG